MQTEMLLPIFYKKMTFMLHKNNIMLLEIEKKVVFCCVTDWCWAQSA